MPLVHVHIFQKPQAMLAASATATPLKTMAILLLRKVTEPTKKYSTSGYSSSGCATSINEGSSITVFNIATTVVINVNDMYSYLARSQWQTWIAVAIILLQIALLDPEDHQCIHA